jgi:hypothetical protein
MMDIVEIFILVTLVYRNNMKAKQKGQNAILWSVLTVISYFFFYTVGMMIVMAYFCNGMVDMALATSMGGSVSSRSQQLAEQWAKAVADKPVRELLVFMIGFGGYLLIRFLLERIPDKHKPEVHWMDKMGDQS